MKKVQYTVLNAGTFLLRHITVHITFNLRLKAIPNALSQIVVPQTGFCRQIISLRYKGGGSDEGAGVLVQIISRLCCNTQHGLTID